MAIGYLLILVDGKLRMELRNRNLLEDVLTE